MLAVGLAAHAVQSATAGEEFAWKPAVKIVGSETSAGQGGVQLKWISHQTHGATADDRVVATSATAPVDSASPSAANPHSDPFGDSNKSVAGSPGNLPADPELDADPPQSTVKGGWGAKSSPFSHAAVKTPSRGLTPSQRVPSLEQQLRAFKRPDVAEKRTSPQDLKSIRSITDTITPASTNVPPECPLGNQRFAARSWAPTTFAWTAAGTCHKPLYFEDVQLERYGHTWGPLWQPIISSAHFFATVPLLPYLMGVDPPRECQYTLGYYRPGNCAPYMLDPFPVSLRGAITAGTFWTGVPLAF